MTKPYLISVTRVTVRNSFIFLLVKEVVIEAFSANRGRTPGDDSNERAKDGQGSSGAAAEQLHLPPTYSPPTVVVSAYFRVS